MQFISFVQYFKISGRIADWSLMEEKSGKQTLTLQGTSYAI